MFKQLSTPFLVALTAAAHQADEPVPVDLLAELDARGIIIPDDQVDLIGLSMDDEGVR